MNQLLLTLFSILTLASCSSPGEGNETADKKEEQTVAQATSQAQTEAVPANYLNGITEKNAGDKSGPLRIHGNVRGPQNGAMIYLLETEGKNSEVIDSTKLTNSAFDFGVGEYNRGFYMLSLNNDPNNMVAFIVNPDEQEIDLNFNSSRLENQAQARVSKENEGWFAYYTIERRIDNEVRGLYRQRSNSAFKERIDQQIADKEAEKVEAQHKFINEYPDTFLAKYLTWKNSPSKGNMGTYWDDIDFTDESLVRTPIMSDRIQEFMRSFSGGKDAGFYNCIDMVKAKAEVNPRVLEFSLYTMLDGFYQSGMEAISMYILDNYIFDDDCGANLSDVIKQRAQGVVNLQIGKTPPNFNIETWDGNKVELMSEVKKHEYTLVMFWASWCHKCEQEIPVLKNVYEVYKNRGFGVVGVSVDNNRQAWVNAVETNELPWPNVSQLQMWDSPVAKDYKVTKTPTFFLLDKDGKIVDKPSRVFQVENFLKAKL